METQTPSKEFNEAVSMTVTAYLNSHHEKRESEIKEMMTRLNQHPNLSSAFAKAANLSDEELSNLEKHLSTKHPSHSNGLYDSIDVRFGEIINQVLQNEGLNQETFEKEFLPILGIKREHFIYSKYLSGFVTELGCGSSHKEV